MRVNRVVFSSATFSNPPSTLGSLGSLLSHLIAISISFAWICQSPAQAAPQTLEGLKMELVAEKSVVQPATAFTVGLRIEHARGYHTYWKNPGIVGVPTKMVWELPEGFVAGEIQWPEPELTMMAIYPVYGYEGEVLLPVTITPPDSLDPEQIPEITLRAKTSWMCCAKTCHPGFSTFEIVLPTAPKTSEPNSTEHQALFAAAASAQPVKSEAWQVTAKRSGEQIIAEIRPATGSEANTRWLSAPDAEKKVYFFSDDGLIDSTAAQKVSIFPGGSGLQIILTVSEHAPEPPVEGAKLTGVLSSKKSWIASSEATAIEINARVDNTEATPHTNVRH